jgi:hypothetical protein
MGLIQRVRSASAVATTGGAGLVIAKIIQSLRRGGVRDLWRITRNIWGSVAPQGTRPDLDVYKRWVARYDTVTPSARFELELAASKLPRHPLISVLVPTYNTRREWLVEAIESIRGQVYPHWELCVADDASREPHVAEVLTAYALLDERIRFVQRRENGHISATSNSALDIARGEWIALLDHDDVLPPHALFWIASAINENPHAQMIYSDEDKITEGGERFGAYFKPDWNPDLFRAQNVFSHLGAFRTDLVRAVGGFRIGFEGSQDYDLALRCVERVRREQIVHVPRVLYHWRVHEGSTALSHDAKPYAVTAGQAALQEHLERQGIEASCERQAAGFRVRYSTGAIEPSVAVVVMGAGPSAAGVKAIQAATAYSNAKFFAVHPRGVQWAGQVMALSGTGLQDGLRIVLQKVTEQQLQFVCLVDGCLRPKQDDWLRELVSQCCRQGVGAVGPKLISDAAIVESAGLVLMPGDPVRPLDAHRGYPDDAVGYAGRAQLVQQYPAVRSACILVPSDVFAATVIDSAVSDVDWGVQVCGKIRQLGLDVIWTPYSELVVHGRLAPLPASSDWRCDPGRDPAYNPNLSARAADFSLAWPPRLDTLQPTGQLDGSGAIPNDARASAR